MICVSLNEIPRQRITKSDYFNDITLSNRVGRDICNNREVSGDVCVELKMRIEYLTDDEMRIMQVLCSSAFKIFKEKESVTRQSICDAITHWYKNQSPNTNSVDKICILMIAGFIDSIMAMRKVEETNELINNLNYDKNT